MTIREAREEALRNEARYAHMSKEDLINAIIYISRDSTVRELCDVLDLEHKARKIKKMDNE